MDVKRGVLKTNIKSTWK